MTARADGGYGLAFARTAAWSDAIELPDGG
jgi:hypothetical protein